MKRLLFLCFLLTQFNFLLAQYTTTGSATQLNESCIRVTEAVTTQVGSAFFDTPIDLSQAFSFSGTMFFGADDAGADGMTFILATDPQAQGNSGGGIGYESISPSLIVEFDTWQNLDLNDPVEDHMGIMSNGIADHNNPATLAPFVILPNIENNEEHCFTIMWDPATLIFEVTLSNFSITYNGDIAALFPPDVDVYYGYTGSTGGAVNEQRICLYDTDALEDLAINEIPPICESDGIQTMTANLPGGTWGGAASSAGQINTITLDAGFHVVSYTIGDLECEYSDEIMIEVLPKVEVSPIGQTNIDCEQGLGSLEVIGENGVEPYTYEWSNGETTSSIENLPAGTYGVTVTDGNGCQAFGNYEIFGDSGLEILNIDLIPEFCDEENIIRGGSLTVSVSSGSEPYLYSINGGITTQEENTFVNLNSEEGTVTVTDINGCVTSQDYAFTFADYPDIEIEASSLELCGENVVLGVNSQESETILWSTGEITDSIIVESAGLVFAVLTNAFGCTDTEEITITECLDYDIPNVFTPNNDNKNETFGLVTDSQSITFFVRIYSRWGELVYEGNQAWDGTVKGKPFPADVLGYVMEINVGGNTVVEKGDVTLIR